MEVDFKRHQKRESITDRHSIPDCVSQVERYRRIQDELDKRSINFHATVRDALDQVMAKAEKEFGIKIA